MELSKKIDLHAHVISDKGLTYPNDRSVVILSYLRLQWENGCHVPCGFRGRTEYPAERSRR